MWSIFTCFQNFGGFANIRLHIPVKIANKVKKIFVPIVFNLNIFSLNLKNIILCLPWRLIFFSNGHIYNVVSMLPNVVKIEVENDNVVSTLFNVLQINVETDNVESTLFNIDLMLCNFAMSYQPKENVETMLKCLLGRFYFKI